MFFLKQGVQKVCAKVSLCANCEQHSVGISFTYQMRKDACGKHFVRPKMLARSDPSLQKLALAAATTNW